MHNQDELEEDILLHSIAGHLQFMVSILQSSPLIQVSKTVVTTKTKQYEIMTIEIVINLLEKPLFEMCCFYIGIAN